MGDPAMSYVSGHYYDREMTLGIVAACAAVMTQAEGKGAKCWRTESKGFHSEAPFRCYWISGVHSPEAVTVCGGHAFIGALVAFTGDTDAMVYARKLQFNIAYHTPLTRAPVVSPQLTESGSRGTFTSTIAGTTFVSQYSSRLTLSRRLLTKVSVELCSSKLHPVHI